MALRTTLSKIHGLSRSWASLNSARSMVNVSTPLNDLVKDDTPTHTGQQFADDDYRLVRFVDKKKHVNKKFAIDLIAEVPPEPKKARIVWCDGGSGPTGHPRVYINLDQPGNHTCGYCGLRFYKEDHHHH